MLKFTKILLPISWMGFIFVLSDIPYDLLPTETTSAQSILAHVILYSVLAYLVISVVSWQPDKRSLASHGKLSFFTVIFCLLYGITDEYHQGFVPGRFVSFLDLALDGVGAVLGVAVYDLSKHKRRVKLLLR